VSVQLLSIVHIAKAVIRVAGRYIMGDEDIKKSIVLFAGEKLLCKVFSTSEASI